jgi:hypothetical protein
MGVHNYWGLQINFLKKIKGKWVAMLFERSLQRLGATLFGPAFLDFYFSQKRHNVTRTGHSTSPASNSPSRIPSRPQWSAPEQSPVNKQEWDAAYLTNTPKFGIVFPPFGYIVGIFFSPVKKSHKNATATANVAK